MKTLAASLSILTQPGVALYLLRGVAFTCILSVLGVIVGLVLGSLLALARTYCKKGPARILGWLASAYIELFRNTPYLLWIFVCVVFCPCPAFFARKMFGLTSVESGKQTTKKMKPQTRYAGAYAPPVEAPVTKL